MTRASVAALALLALALATRPAAALEVPPLRGRVNDLARLLAPERAAALERKLADFERETSHQIVVLTVPSLEGDPIEDFSIRVADAWKIGWKGLDNGAIVIVAPADRAARIEMGRGLSGVVPDVVSARILRERMIPRFRDGDFAGGIEEGVDALLAAARGEVIPEDRRPRPQPANDPFAVVLFSAFFGAIFGTPLRRGPLRLLGALVGGGIAGLLTWVLLSVGAWTALAAALGAVLGFVLPGPSGLGRRGGLGGGIFPGGGWGGGGGGWGGGGGFGGGGGGFDGGGATGRW